MKNRTTPEILQSLADKVGCKITLEPRYGLAGQIAFPDGRYFYFKNTSLDINAHGASELAKDKGYTRYFMERLRYKIPRGQNFFSDHWCEVNHSSDNKETALKYADSLGYPLIVKPNSGSKGRDVYMVGGAADLPTILDRLFEKNNIILIEEFISGDDHRLVVLGDECLIAYKRMPLTVVGDGATTLLQLFEKKKIEEQEAGRKIAIEASDSRMNFRLENFYKKDWSYIPGAGESIQLLDNANLSSGGEAIDVTDIIHESYKDAAVKLARDMGLQFAGVDFITTDDITKPIQNATFIEINSSPGLLHYQTLSEVAAGRVEDLYLKILNKLKEPSFNF